MKTEKRGETNAPLARRRAHECRVRSRALSKADPHRKHEYAPVLTEWMCRWNVSARTPPSSSSHPRRGHRRRPSVRELCSIASVASSLCRNSSEDLCLGNGEGGGACRETYRFFELVR